MKMESARYRNTCVNSPDFFDFDKMRCEECFAAGQIWALYDEQDAMPRLYAQIRRVFPSRLEFRVTWLEADPDGENDPYLPTGSCGKFKSGSRETVFELPCFSHQVYPFESSGRGGVFKIFPRKGSTWALFKNWGIEWRSNQVRPRYEYDVVEVVTNYEEPFGVCVAFLGKVKGFVSVFCKINRDALKVVPGEMWRFSHMIPSFQLTGEEGEGVPKDSFELDPLSLPKGIEEISVVGFGLNVGKTHSSGQCSSPSPAEVDDDDDDEYPVPDFNDFRKLRKNGCFSAGQTWAVYDTLDAMPRFYVMIGKVWSPGSKLWVSWLEPNPDAQNEIEWVKADFPTSCGKFKRGDGVNISDWNCFSHQVYPVESSQREGIKILPRKGSTWALFMNWDIMWKSHQVPGRKRKSHQVPEQKKHEYEYDFVEVLDDYAEDVGLRVAFLGKLKGFVSVFSRINTKNTQQIPPGELFRFSHMVPSFKLTGEEGEGVPKDSFELDPFSLPKNIEEFTIEWFRFNVSNGCHLH